MPRPINPVVAQQITAINQQPYRQRKMYLDAVAAPAPEEESREDTKGEGEVPIPKAMMIVVTGTPRAEMTVGTAIGDDGGGAESDSGSADAGGGGSDSSMQSAVLENNTDIQQIRKTGRW